MFSQNVRIRFILPCSNRLLPSDHSARSSATNQRAFASLHNCLSWVVKTVSRHRWNSLHSMTQTCIISYSLSCILIYILVYLTNHYSWINFTHYRRKYLAQNNSFTFDLVGIYFLHLLYSISYTYWHYAMENSISWRCQALQATQMETNIVTYSILCDELPYILLEFWSRH